MKQALQINEKAGLKRVHVDMVMEEDIAEVISGWTGIPMTKISETESKKLLNMEEILHERLIGQHQAIVSVSKAIRRARVGLRNPDRPIASFIFAGPTGVGKTELTKALASYMFGSEETMVRLDMSEYMEKHTVAKLIGSPPGYVGYSEGGQLTEAVRSKPYTVVLFDEVEKAHPDVFNLLLQILDDGRLTDSKGRTIDFKNTLIIMTSNVGAKIIEKESGIQSRKPNQSTLDINSDFLAPANDTVIDPTVFKRITYLVNEELKKYFRPEFLNRLDEIIVFSHLTRQDVKQISEIMIKQLQNRMKEKEIELEVRNGVKEILVEQGFDPIYGARPLRRAVMRLLEDNLAQEFLAKPLYPKTKLIVDADIDDNIIVNVDYSHVDPKLRADEETIEIVENK
jgi:ATP-dependent Clp protease ATP-binding subunit ClpC